MLLTAVNAPNVPFVIVISHHVNVVVASLAVPVTKKLAPLKYVPTVPVNVTVGHAVSYVVLIVFETVLLFPAASVATPAPTLTLTAHCALGVTVRI